MVLLQIPKKRKKKRKKLECNLKDLCRSVLQSFRLSLILVIKSRMVITRSRNHRNKFSNLFFEGKIINFIDDITVVETLVGVLYKHGGCFDGPKEPTAYFEVAVTVLKGNGNFLVSISQFIIELVGDVTHLFNCIHSRWEDPRGRNIQIVVAVRGAFTRPSIHEDVQQVEADFLKTVTTACKPVNRTIKGINSNYLEIMKTSVEVLQGKSELITDTLQKVNFISRQCCIASILSTTYTIQRIRDAVRQDEITYKKTVTSRHDNRTKQGDNSKFSVNMKMFVEVFHGILIIIADALQEMDFISRQCCQTIRMTRRNIIPLRNDDCSVINDDGSVIIMEDGWSNNVNVAESVNAEEDKRLSQEDKSSTARIFDDVIHGETLDPTQQIHAAIKIKILVLLESEKVKIDEEVEHLAGPDRNKIAMIKEINSAGLDGIGDSQELHKKQATALASDGAPDRNGQTQMFLFRETHSGRVQAKRNGENNVDDDENNAEDACTEVGIYKMKNFSLGKQRPCIRSQSKFL